MMDAEKRLLDLYNKRECLNSSHVDHYSGNTDGGHTELKRYILLAETDAIYTAPNRGLLYKKKGDDGLWWRTSSGEVNVLNGTTVPIKPAGFDNKELIISINNLNNKMELLFAHYIFLFCSKSPDKTLAY